MNKLICILITGLVAMPTFAADVLCSVTFDNKPEQAISKKLQLMDTYEQTLQLVENQNFKVEVYASGGKFVGIGILDKNKGISIGNQGLEITVSMISGRQSSEKIRVQCLDL